MTTVVARLEAILTARTEDFTRKMDKSEHKMSTLGKAAGIAGTAVVTGLAFGLERSVKAAVKAESSQTRLEQAFKNSGLAIGPYTKAIDEAERSGRKLGFTDEDTKTSLGSLLTATGSVAKSMHALAVAQDIARFKGVDQEAATKMLTMAMTGSQRAAKQLGISVQPVTSAFDALSKNATKAEIAHAKFIDKQRTGNAVIEAVRKHLHGQAEAYSKTAAGGMAQFHAQLDHLEVSMGKALLPILVKVSEKLASFMDFLSKHTTTAKIIAAAIGVFAVAMVGLSVASTAASIGMSAFWIAATAGLILIIPALIALIVVLVKKWDDITAAMGSVVDYITGTFLGVWNDTLDALKKVYNWAKDNWPLLLGILTGPIGLAIGELVKHYGTIKADVVKLKTFFSDKLGDIAGFFTALPGKIANLFTSGWPAALTMIQKPFHDFVNWIDPSDGAGPIASIANFFGNLPAKVGAAIVGGAKDIRDAVEGLFGKVIGWVKGVLGIKSPSSVFHSIGQHVIKGFVNGVGSMAGLLEKAVVQMVKNALHKVTGFLPSGESKTPGSNENVGQQMAARFGWSQGPEWFEGLLPLWMKESGWSQTADTRVSGLDPPNASVFAYGIPQARPYSKMPHSAWPSDKGGHSDAVAQIRWGLNYIKSTYGDPLAAMAHERSYGWYDKGGWLPPGLSMALNTTGRPERVVSGHGETVVIPVSIGGENIATVVFDMLRRRAQVFENRNGRPAFGDI